MFRRLLILLALLLLPSLVQARGIEPELVAEGPAPPGGEVDVAIHMRTNPGWHGYWLNPGDAGLPMDVQWQLPRGFSAGPLRYPVPSRLTVADLMNYVYEHDYAVLVRLKVPADARGTVPIRADAHWLACTDKICVPEQGQLALDLPVGSGSPNRAQFDEWRRACRGRWRRSGVSKRLATRSTSQSRFRRASASDNRTCSRSPTRWSIMRRSRASAAPATCSLPSSSARGQRPRNSPECWRLAMGGGSNFTPCRERCRLTERPSAASVRTPSCGRCLARWREESCST